MTGGQDVAGLMKRKLVRRMENRAQRRRNRALDALASTLEKLEVSDVQDVEDLRELSESLCEGLTAARETLARLGEKNKNSR